MVRRLLLVLLAVSCMAVYAVPAKAIVLDFYDNVAAPPGFYGLAYYNYYDMPKMRDNSGGNVQTSRGDNLNLSVQTMALRPVYFWNGLGTTWAINAIIPFGSATGNNLTTGAKQTSSGLGDVLISPAVFLFQHEKTGTYLSFWEFVSAPTGAFSKTRAAQGGPNLGLGYWYFEQELAFATSFYEKSPFSFDMNINYFLKASTSDMSPGDSLEIEGIFGYGLTNMFRVGAYGAYYGDVQKSKMFGQTWDKAEYWRAGPSFSYGTEKWGFNFRYVYDFSAENAPQGSQAWLRFNYAF